MTAVVSFHSNILSETILCESVIPEEINEGIVGAFPAPLNPDRCITSLQLAAYCTYSFVSNEMDLMINIYRSRTKYILGNLEGKLYIFPFLPLLFL